ncbi:MAG TPA: MBL fold metallo-hydrolase [Candidatus Dormibacteraeota bacterium]|nr:MBL fold metallo-hydrolase [Candidatus Dormibacteraeota bacterium]
MKLGDWEIDLLTDGLFALDGGAMFGVVPRPLWEKKAPPDDRNRIRLAMNCCLLRGLGRTILIETGAGDKWDSKHAGIYKFEKENRLLDRLAALGVRPEEIDTVVNTHLHFDHCGWNTRRQGDQVVPTFPGAAYVVQRGELEHARQPNERDHASYLRENFEPIDRAGQWRPVEGDAQLAPGVELIVAAGHTRDMQCVKISGGGQTAVFLADLVPTRAHLPYAWIMGYDLFPMTTLENKKQWLPRLAREGWLCLFAHDADVPAAYLRERDGKFETEPAPLG